MLGNPCDMKKLLRYQKNINTYFRGCANHGAKYKKNLLERTVSRSL